MEDYTIVKRGNFYVCVSHALYEDFDARFLLPTTFYFEIIFLTKTDKYTTNLLCILRESCSKI